ncbi:MAG: efflux RND transporter periplasmic adaptor subunit [Bryobacterales bacterium]|nr:efflux RND transporter periplasmic adaptor subunit [Bryobacterales bacterium]
MTTPRTLGAIFIAAALATLGMAGCAKKETKAEAHTQAPPPRDPMEIDLDKELRARVKLGEPHWAQVGATLTVAARVEVDETRVTRVGSPVMGRIASLSVREGEHVRAGQVLATLNSVGLSEAQLNFLKGLSQKLVTERAVVRAQQLLKADVIGSAELQRREAELAQATAELAAARDELELLGMPAEAIEALERTRNIHSVSRVVASSSGTVLERHVTIGQVIQPADTVFEIADLSHVWLVADVPEQIAGSVVVGMAVEAQVAALGNQIFSGMLTFVSATVNPQTRTVRARMELGNPARRLKPAMLATMVLKNQTERRQVVPLAAVVREGEVEHVFVKLDDDTFVLKPVQLGPEYGGNRVLLEGLREGDQIIVDGAFHLNNERRRRAVRGNDGD